MSEYVNIFDFTKFRKFLEEYQESRQKSEPKFTRTEFCNRLGLPRTRSYFNDVLRGKPVTPEMQGRFEKVIGLKGAESKYFDAMIRFDQAKVGDARDKAFEEMLALNPHPQVIVDPESFALFSNWYNVVLFHLLEVESVKDDLSGLARKIFPPVPQKKLEKSLALLQKMRLVRKNGNGDWKPTRESFSTVQQCKDKMVLQYQKQCLELSKEVLESPGKESRDMTTFSFSVSKKGRNRVEREVEKFKERIRRIVAADMDVATEVEHINLHVFSHLREKDAGGER